MKLKTKTKKKMKKTPKNPKWKVMLGTLERRPASTQARHIENIKDTEDAKLETFTQTLSTLEHLVVDRTYELNQRLEVFEKDYAALAKTNHRLQAKIDIISKILEL